MTRFPVLLVVMPAALLLGGCPQPVVEAPPAPPAVVGLALPPANTEFRYAGRWATQANLCGVAEWEFTPGGFSTPGEVTCRFNTITRVPGGYQVGATCFAEGPATQHSILITFAESAQAMLLDGSPTAAAGLVYCGPNIPNQPLPPK
jgi:hypothetical protein